MEETQLSIRARRLAQRPLLPPPCSCDAGAPPTSIQVTTSPDVRRRMARCGLAASLDHTLRLTYSAQDAGDAEVAEFLGRTRLAWSGAVDARLVSVVPPTSGTGSERQAQGCGSTDGGGRGEGEIQLGIVFTLSKRAAMLTRALEAVSGVGAAGARAQGQGAGQRRRQILDWAADVLALLVAAANSMEGSVRERVEAAGREAAAVSGAGGCSDAVWREDAVCLDEVQEALALAARAASNLAAPLGWELAADIGTAAGVAAARGRAGAVQWSSAQELGPRAMCELLACTLQWWRRALLPPAQLQACQPHRLLAAACALAAALPGLQVSNSRELESSRKRVCVLVPDLLVIMSAHETLSGRVRMWLAPPPAAASSSASGGGSGSSGSGAEPEACAGCLEAPVRTVTKRALKAAPTDAVLALALLKIAAGQGGSTEGRAGADGGFRHFAAAVGDFVVLGFGNPSRNNIMDVPTPDGSTLEDVLVQEVGGPGDLPPPPPPVAPSGVLPPPLTLPPSRQGALPRLRVCGNPWCGNFAEECEGALPLKQCGGCRAVRYCGADCQRAHWRAGHKADCKLMVAEAGK